MSKLVWDATGAHLFETGVSKGVVFPINAQGVYDHGYAWNGLTSVSEKPSGAEATALYADNIKYLNLISAEEFAATVEAYCYPDEFAVLDGSAELATGVSIGQQNRGIFGLCYRTEIGNDVDGNNHGYKLHIVYGAQASPSEKSYGTINDSPEAITFSWELTTTPVNVTGFKPTALLTLDSTKCSAAKLKELEAILYGISAAEFSASKTYVVGDYVTHADGATTKTYKCTTAITVAGAWDPDDWTEVTNPDSHLILPDAIATLFEE